MTRRSTQKLLASTAFASKLPGLISDYEVYKAAERGIKVFIEAIVNNTWICDNHNPEAFYSNVTALAI
jgi:hypothetical protein